jgi:hypothetical protein
MVQKDAALTVFDTHAGAGLYRLDGDYAQTSAEAAEGYLKLVASKPVEPIAPLLQDYLDLVAGFNKQGSHKVYPGSPFIIHQVIQERDRDKLKLFELHPTDTKTLTANIAQLEAGRQIAILREDGFQRGGTLVHAVEVQAWRATGAQLLAQISDHIQTKGLDGRVSSPNACRRSRIQRGISAPQASLKRISWVELVMGMMPGTTGTSRPAHPRLRQIGSRHPSCRNTG